MDLEGEVILIICMLLFSIIWAIMFFLVQKEKNLSIQILKELEEGNSVVLYLENNIKKVLSGKEWIIFRKERSYFLSNLEESFSLDDVLKNKIKISFIKGEKNDF